MAIEFKSVDDSIQDVYETLQDEVRYELRAINADGEVISKVSDRDIDTVTSDVSKDQVEGLAHQALWVEATEDVYSREPMEYGND